VFPNKVYWLNNATADALCYFYIDIIFQPRYLYHVEFKNGI